MALAGRDRRRCRCRRRRRRGCRRAQAGRVAGRGSRVLCDRGAQFSHKRLSQQHRGRACAVPQQHDSRRAQCRPGKHSASLAGRLDVLAMLMLVGRAIEAKVLHVGGQGRRQGRHITGDAPTKPQLLVRLPTSLSPRLPKRQLWAILHPHCRNPLTHRPWFRGSPFFTTFAFTLRARTPVSPCPCP
jgi:hypothetical protein